MAKKTKASKDYGKYKVIMLGGLSEIGKNKQFLRMSFLLQNGLTMVGLLFRGCEEFRNAVSEKYGEQAISGLLSGRRSGVKISFTYYPQINDFRGDTSLQVVLSEVRVS